MLIFWKKKKQKDSSIFRKQDKIKKIKIQIKKPWKYKLNNIHGQIRLLYIFLLKGLLFGFSISLESHSCWQYLRIKSFLDLIQGFLVHDEFDANISERQEQDYTVMLFLFYSG